MKGIRIKEEGIKLQFFGDKIILNKRIQMMYHQIIRINEWDLQVCFIADQ